MIDIRQWAVVATEVTSWPRTGVALLICVLVILAIATIMVNLRGGAAQRGAEVDPLALPHPARDEAAVHEPIDV